VSRRERKKTEEAATTSPKMATSSSKMATSSTKMDTYNTKNSTYIQKIDTSGPNKDTSSPEICKQLIRKEIERPNNAEPLIIRRSFGRLGSVALEPRQRLTSVSMASPDPEEFDWIRDSFGGLSSGFSKMSRSVTRKSARRDVSGRYREENSHRSSSLLIPNMMSAASLSIGSADPELFDISEWNVKQRGFSLGTYRESSLGKFVSSDNSITLTVGVMVCNSFQQYHLRRDEIISTPYEIHVEEYNKNWAREAAEVCKWLEGMDCSKKYWHKVQHIGSTSIPDMVGKPIIDIMITLTEEDKFKEAVDEFLREQFEIKKLPVKIGFTGKAPFSNDDWGFFQVPRQWAEKIGICEVNIHIFNKNSTNALEKNLFRNYLTSSEGHELKKEYCEIKRKLMKELNGGLKVSDYALRKNEIVSKILDKAYLWNFKNEDVKEPILGKPKSIEHCATCPTDINLSNQKYSPPLEAKEEKSDKSKSLVKEKESKSNIRSKTSTS